MVQKGRGRWRQENSKQDRSRREGTETRWNQDIKAYKSLDFNVKKKNTKSKNMTPSWEWPHC